MHQAPQLRVADVLQTVLHLVGSFLEVGLFHWHPEPALRSTSIVACQFLQR